MPLRQHLWLQHQDVIASHLRFTLHYVTDCLDFVKICDMTAMIGTCDQSRRLAKASLCSRTRTFLMLLVMPGFVYGLMLLTA